MPKVRSGNAEIGFDVFSTNTSQTNTYDNKLNSPTSFGIRINY
jgi:hypothetical protein